MKNIIIRSLVLAFVLAAGAAMAQTERDTAQHQVNVSIPEIAFIRIVNGNAPVASPDAVEFSFTATTYETGTALAPTNADPFNWDDVQVLVNKNASWEVMVSASGSTGFDWSKVTMSPSNASDYNLGSDATIKTSSAKTSGWLDLGIDPANYEVTFNGTEDPATYTSTVTFTLQNP